MQHIDKYYYITYTSHLDPKDRDETLPTHTTVSQPVSRNYQGPWLCPPSKYIIHIVYVAFTAFKIANTHKETIAPGLTDHDRRRYDFSGTSSHIGREWSCILLAQRCYLSLALLQQITNKTGCLEPGFGSSSETFDSKTSDNSEDDSAPQWVICMRQNT